MDAVVVQVHAGAYVVLSFAYRHTHGSPPLDDDDDDVSFYFFVVVTVVAGTRSTTHTARPRDSGSFARLNFCKFLFPAVDSFCRLFDS